MLFRFQKANPGLKWIKINVGSYSWKYPNIVYKNQLKLLKKGKIWE